MKKMTVQNNRIIAATLAATISLSAVVVSKFEGLEFAAYKDPVGVLQGSCRVSRTFMPLPAAT